MTVAALDTEPQPQEPPEDARIEQAVAHLRDFAAEGALESIRSASRLVREMERELTDTPEMARRRMMKRLSSKAVTACGMTPGKRRALGMRKGR